MIDEMQQEQMMEEPEVLEQGDTVGGVTPPATANPGDDQEEIDISKREKEKLLPRLITGFMQYADHRTEWEDHWRESNAIYEGRDGEDSQWPYSSRYEIPEAFRQCEGMKAFIMQGFFGQPHWFEYRARHNGAEEDANISSHIVRWQIKHFDMENDIITWPAEVVHHGVSYCQYGWSRFKRLKYKFNRTENEEFNASWEREAIEEIHGAPFVEYLSPWKVYHHPGVDRVEQSPLCYVVEHVSGDYLLTQARNGFFRRDAVLRALKERQAMPQDVAFWKGNDNELLGDPEFELMYCWTNGGRVYAIVNREHIVQANQNEYGEIPLLNQRNYQSPGNPYGISEPKQLQPEQALIRDMMSMGVDSTFFKLQPMWIYNSELSRYFGNQDFAFKPGMAFQSDSKDAISPVATTAESGQIFAHADRIRQYAQLKTSYTDIVSGAGTQGANTAFAHGRLQDAASSRLQARMMLWEPRLRKLYEKLHSLNAAYLDEKVAVQVEGVSGGRAFGRYRNNMVAYSDNPLGMNEEVSPGFGPESFEPEIDVIVEMPRTMGSPMERQQRLMAFWQVIAQDPRWAAEPVMEEIARAFEFPNPKRLIVRPETSQRDAAKENADFFAHGVIPDPLSSEDHQVHLELHSYVPKLPEFAQLPETTRGSWITHMQIHAAYLQKIQAMQMGQSGMPGGMGEPTGDGAAPDVRQESTDMAEQASGPGGQGAMAMGAPPQ